LTCVSLDDLTSIESQFYHEGMEERPLLGRQLCFPLSRTAKNQTGHHSLSAAARGDNFKRNAAGDVLRNGRTIAHNGTLPRFSHCPTGFVQGDKARTVSAQIQARNYCRTLSAQHAHRRTSFSAYYCTKMQQNA
jgi:hypothetical protein